MRLRLADLFASSFKIPLRFSASRLLSWARNGRICGLLSSPLSDHELTEQPGLDWTVLYSTRAHAHAARGGSLASNAITLQL